LSSPIYPVRIGPMLLETDQGFQTTNLEQLTSYEEYLLAGGRLPYEDFTFITETLSGNSPTPFETRRCPNSSQISGICDLCGVQLSPEEIHIYRNLRIKMPSDKEISPNQPNIVNPWQMHDVELAREIFLLTDPTREKYQIVTESFPHMFRV